MFSRPTKTWYYYKCKECNFENHYPEGLTEKRRCVRCHAGKDKLVFLRREEKRA